MSHRGRRSHARSAARQATLSAINHELLQKWCTTTRCKFNELEKILRSLQMKFAARDRVSGGKTLVRSSLRGVTQLTSDIARLVNTIQSSLIDKDPESDYCKYAMDELKYFTYEWKNVFKGEVDALVVEQCEWSRKEGMEDNLTKYDIS